jgi:hypothetical protein
VLGRFVPLERFGPVIGFGVFFVTGLVIWAMSGYRCPACGRMPRARMLAFGSAELTYSSMVAICPRACSSCGVRFKASVQPTHAGPTTRP